MVSIVGGAQNKDYARGVLDTLCSPAFEGRGYYNQGERKAAEFIKNEYVKHGLKAIDGSYFQFFKTTANSIQGDLQFNLPNQTLKAGEEFIVSPSSPSFSGKGELVFVTRDELLKPDEYKKNLRRTGDKFIVIDKTLVKEEAREVQLGVNQLIDFIKYSRALHNKGVIEITDANLTYTASLDQAVRPHVVLHPNKNLMKAKEVELSIESYLDADYQSQNVIGLVEGKVKDSFIYVVGHYDHLGRMGDDVYFPGANDNASGIAMLLSLASDLAKEEKLKYSVVFICFGSEETGLIGSKYYTENPFHSLDQIKFLINLDILGTGDDGIRVVNGTIHQQKFDELVQLNQDKALLKEVKIRGKSCNSDHCHFSEKGVPGFFIYTLGGIAHYHNIYDKPETLPLTEYDDLFVLLKQFVMNF